MPRQKPEEQAREQIDAMLVTSGWAIQNYKELNLGVARGIAIREVPLTTGPCDYLLLVDRIPLGIVEAKKAGTTLSGVSEQSAVYAEALPDFLAELVPVFDSNERGETRPYAESRRRSAQYHGSPSVGSGTDEDQVPQPRQFAGQHRSSQRGSLEDYAC